MQVLMYPTAAAAVLAACGGSDNDDAPTPPPVAKNLVCDDSMKTEFKPDANTSVLLVKAFKKGDPLILSGTAGQNTPTALNDVCMVKLNVGPGNPGPEGAPSTSPGIGIEVWLPTAANWNKRVHNVGGGGWQGGTAGSTTALAGAAGGGGPGGQPANSAKIAGAEGAVSSTTNTGHGSLNSSGAFTMNPDGTVNKALWTDFSERSLYEQGVKSKALATAYYGSPPSRMYWEGGSTGGRQGMKMAQAHPELYDGIVANYPVVNWSKFIIGAMAYPQIVKQRDLGGVNLSNAQHTLIGNAAVNACDVVNGVHMGYIPDPSQCSYDPTKDAAVLCTGETGNAGVVGTNATAACVNLAQATFINKTWYGQTRDGSVPDPSVDNAWGLAPSGNHLWYGIARGTNTIPLAGASEDGLQIDMVALALQDPTIAGSSFKNATGNGAFGYKALSYAQFANAWDRAVALDATFGNINTDKADLSAYAARGGKILTWHGLADVLVPPQNTVNYYNRVATQMGGFAAVQNFYKVYLVPGGGHAAANGTPNPNANPPAVAEGQLYALLTTWVEQGTAAPNSVVLNTPSGTAKSRPMCAYPQKAAYVSGDPNIATSYLCQ